MGSDRLAIAGRLRKSIRRERNIAMLIDVSSSGSEDCMSTRPLGKFRIASSGNDMMTVSLIFHSHNWWTAKSRAETGTLDLASFSFSSFSFLLFSSLFFFWLLLLFNFLQHLTNQHLILVSTFKSFTRQNRFTVLIQRCGNCTPFNSRELL